MWVSFGEVNYSGINATINSKDKHLLFRDWICTLWYIVNATVQDINLLKTVSCDKMNKAQLEWVIRDGIYGIFVN